MAGDWLNPPVQFVHRSAIALTADKDVRSLRYEAFRASKTNPACPTSDECDLSIQLAAHFSRRSSFFASFNHVVTANPFELSLLAAP